MIVLGTVAGLIEAGLGVQSEVNDLGYRGIAPLTP